MASVLLHYVAALLLTGSGLPGQVGRLLAHQTWERLLPGRAFVRHCQQPRPLKAHVCMFIHQVLLWICCCQMHCLLGIMLYQFYGAAFTLGLCMMLLCLLGTTLVNQSEEIGRFKAELHQIVRQSVLILDGS